MSSIGVFEAKTHLSDLLERVVNGEEIVITKHGKPMAKLVAAGRDEDNQIAAAITLLKELRKGTTLGDISWKALRDEGRR